MGSLTEAKKRDFINQMIELINDEQSNLNELGFNPENKLTELVALKSSCSTAEIAQQQALAQAKEATLLSQNELEKAYKAASNLGDAISGILGKDSEIVKRMRKFRN
ncbi:hypothetical protein KDU71_15655 [Carboxylicivirga sediminis]|uniref:Uncharacterized protein n=1 Tax=Carboxylicivirga sediminis TaxID=2006564 RepID=A0A941F6R8_9BACT|nr:hypothetical protein [Carboxylicivirga sediminis]MBR8537008.1 hypothetical protein [Carboxylicivirga sediminis]